MSIKAYAIDEIDQSVQINEPVGPEHPFYVDFSSVRGDFRDMFIYRALKVNPIKYTYSEIPQVSKSLVFLGGMRGSGKSSEIRKYVNHLENPDCFLCVLCDVDRELDMNNSEYMDIVILQTEKLLEKARQFDLKLESDIVDALLNWFSSRMRETTDKTGLSGQLETEMSAGTPGILKLFTLTARLRASVFSGTETATVIRTMMRNNFNEFALKFNEFLEKMSQCLREKGIARDILFIIDGLEKLHEPKVRYKIIMEEQNRIQMIRANTLFILPIELMQHREKLRTFTPAVWSFPFIKIQNKDGAVIPEAYACFRKFVYKRIDEVLFDSQETVDRAIAMSGGSPRELLRILLYAAWFEENTSISMNSMEKAIEKLANEYSQYVTPEDIHRLKQLKANNVAGIQTPFDDGWQRLHEYLYVFEYNDGTNKQVNPLLAASKLYQHHVGAL